jgi:FkbM family methyltransferase
MSQPWLDLIHRTIPDVRTIDLGGGRTNNRKSRGGWQAKVEAIIASRFDELLFLDADSFPLRDPSGLFDEPTFRDNDLVLWPDFRTYDKRLQEVIQAHHGVTLTGRQIESGQMLVRRKEAMPGLLKTRDINRASGAAYKYLFGDKDTFLIGAVQAGTKVTRNRHPVRGCSGRNIMQYDFAGQRMFCHLTGGKWEPHKPSNVAINDYPHYAEAMRVFCELREAEVWPFPSITEEFNMRVRDTTGAVEAAKIVQDDMYIIRPMMAGGRVKRIVDLGGCSGAFTFMASLCYPEAEIIVVEPDPELMDDIRYNTRNCKAKIYYVQAACVGEPQETVPFLRVQANRGGGHVRAGAWPGEREPVTPVQPDDVELTVPAYTLPALLDKFGFASLDVLKIDCEGAEGEILLSLKAAGWMPRVHWIRGEWHGRSNWPKIEEALRETHEFRLLEDTALLGFMIAHNRSDA